MRRYQVILTNATPWPSGASCAKASGQRSRMRPGPYGPRSSITTVMLALLSRFVTVTLVPNGSDVWAAYSPRVGQFGYQVASPNCVRWVAGSGTGYVP